MYSDGDGDGDSDGDGGVLEEKETARARIQSNSNDSAACDQKPHDVSALPLKCQVVTLQHVQIAAQMQIV